MNEATVTMQEVKKGEVAISLDELKKSLVAIGEGVERLEQALTPVSRVLPNEQSDDKKMSERVPLATEIRSQAELAQKFARRLENMRASLEL